MTVWDFGQKEVWSTDCSEINFNNTRPRQPSIFIHISYFQGLVKERDLCDPYCDLYVCIGGALPYRDLIVIN